MLVRQLVDDVVHVKATEPWHARSEHAFLDSRHRERVDGRVVVQVARHVDRQQAVVRNRRQLATTELRHRDQLGCVCSATVSRRP